GGASRRGDSRGVSGRVRAGAVEQLRGLVLGASRVMTRVVDVVIVGGGPAGGAVAAGLARRGVRTLVVDGASRMSWPGESLPPGSDRIVAPVFGTRPLENLRHRVAYGNRSAWVSDELETTDFLFNPLGNGW